MVGWEASIARRDRRVVVAPLESYWRVKWPASKPPHGPRFVWTFAERAHYLD